MRVLGLTLAMVSLGCSGDDDGGVPEDAGDVVGDPDAAFAPDAGELGCDLLSAIRLEGDPVPGSTVDLVAVDGGSGRAYEVGWSVPSGALGAPTGPTVSWTIAADLAVHRSETLAIRAAATAAGCEDDVLDLNVEIDWPDGMRTVVIYDPQVPRSDEVASSYAGLRAVPDENLCAVGAADRTTLAGSDYPDFLALVMDCVHAVGDRVHVLVPVWGVPYKVEGRILDFVSGQPTTTSLDALLFFGEHGLDLREPTIANPVYQDGDSRSGVHDPYRPFGELRELVGYDYFLVARIDGADADAALALVDRTAAADEQAQRGALGGVVYVDGNRGEPHPDSDDFGSYEAGEWNIIGVETVFEALGWYDVVADYQEEELGTPPAPLECPDALYYAGWYSFGNYNDVFTWRPGAIGGHLDSCSACDLRGDRDWSARALRRGITATFGAVNEPYVAGMPEYDQFFAYLTAGASYGEAAYESTILGAWMMVWVGDPLYRPYGSQ